MSLSYEVFDFHFWWRQFQRLTVKNYQVDICKVWLFAKSVTEILVFISPGHWYFLYFE